MPGVVPRSSARVPTYPSKIACGVALSITMGAASCMGSDPNVYRMDAQTVSDSRLDSPGDPNTDASDGARTPGVDAGLGEAGADAPMILDTSKE